MWAQRISNVRFEIEEEHADQAAGLVEGRNPRATQAVREYAIEHMSGAVKSNSYKLSDSRHLSRGPNKLATAKKMSVEGGAPTCQPVS